MLKVWEDTPKQARGTVTETVSRERGSRTPLVPSHRTRLQDAYTYQNGILYRAEGTRQ